MRQRSFKIVAIGDAYCSLYNKEGINVEAAIEYCAQNHKSLQGYTEKGIQTITNAELLALNVDVLFPAALENQITKENAGDAQAKVIVEGANGPTSKAADEILNKKEIIVIPDILANAGGVVVSYFEWVQNIESFMWDEDYKQ